MKRILFEKTTAYINVWFDKTIFYNLYYKINPRNQIYKTALQRSDGFDVSVLGDFIDILTDKEFVVSRETRFENIFRYLWEKHKRF